MQRLLLVKTFRLLMNVDTVIYPKQIYWKPFICPPLIDEPLIQLSNGENKRLQILKAVLGFHKLIILDEPFTGLDQDGRRLLDDILFLLSAFGQQLMLLTSRDHIPACFNKLVSLQNGNFRF